MMRFSRATAVAALVGLGLMVAPMGATAEAPGNIRDLMGENFQNLHVILGELITAQYGDVPNKVGVIRHHAEWLGQNIPDDIRSEADRDLFKTYANTLRIRAENMITVAEELNRRDQRATQEGELRIDYLRATVAEHFGQIITTCVLCHNQFRRRVVVQ